MPRELGLFSSTIQLKMFSTCRLRLRACINACIQRLDVHLPQALLSAERTKIPHGLRPEWTIATACLSAFQLFTLSLHRSPGTPRNRETAFSDDWHHKCT
jgi:hypothetical protein